MSATQSARQPQSAVTPAIGTRVRRGASRRANPRTACRLDCFVKLFDAAQAEWVQRPAQIVNLSDGGIALHIAFPLTPGARIEAVVTDGGSPARSLSGEVVHVRRLMVGAYQVGVVLRAGAARV